MTFVGVEEDFLSRQLDEHRSILGDRVLVYPKLPRDECLRLVRAANVTLCYSLSECLPLYVLEGMLAGHPILRNGCSGLEEQLIADWNGFYLDS